MLRLRDRHTVGWSATESMSYFRDDCELFGNGMLEVLHALQHAFENRQELHHLVKKRRCMALQLLERA